MRLNGHYFAWHIFLETFREVVCLDGQKHRGVSSVDRGSVNFIKTGDVSRDLRIPGRVFHFFLKRRSRTSCIWSVQ